MDEERLIEAAALPDDPEFDVALRPRTLDEFVGQERVKEQLLLLIDGARQRGEPVDHLLFSGPPGLGKTTLGQIVANEMGAGFQPTSGPALDRPSDLAAILTQPRGRRRAVRRRDPSHAEDGRGGPVSGARGFQPRRRPRQGADGPEHPAGAAAVHVDRGDDPSRSHHAAAARAVRVLAATGLLPGRRPGSDRAAIRGHPRASRRTPTARTRSPSAHAARRASRTDCSVASVTSPRFATTASSPASWRGRGSRCSRSTSKVWIASTTTCSVRSWRSSAGGPVGLSTLAAAVGEEPDTIEDVVEPYLMQLGFLKRTPRGRVATERAFRHLGDHHARHLAHLAAALHRFCRSEGRLRGRIDPDPVTHTATRKAHTA